MNLLTDCLWGESYFLSYIVDFMLMWNTVRMSHWEGGWCSDAIQSWIWVFLRCCNIYDIVDCNMWITCCIPFEALYWHQIRDPNYKIFICIINNYNVIFMLRCPFPDKIFIWWSEKLSGLISPWLDDFPTSYCCFKGFINLYGWFVIFVCWTSS